ncbi:MAG: hypothetical protein PHP88_13070, partial [bacterium]|nr:hypothetical protein [bacterium]
IDNAKFRDGGTTYYPPASEKAGIPATVTALYGRGLKAQLRVSVPKYQLRNMGFALGYAYLYPDRGGMWDQFFPDDAGVFQATRAYKPVDRYGLRIIPQLQVFNPVLNRTETGSLWSWGGEGEKDTVWTSDNLSFRQMQQDLLDGKFPGGEFAPSSWPIHFTLPVVTGERWNESPLFRDETLDIRYQTVFRGNGEEETVSKSVPVHIETPIVVPPLLDFTQDLPEKVKPEKQGGSYYISMYEGDIRIPMLERDLSQLDVSLRRESGKEKGMGLLKSTYSYWSIWGDDSIGERVRITATHPGIPKTHSGETVVEGVTDYSTGTASLVLPEETPLPAAKADDPRCSDPTHTSSGSFAGGVGTELDPFVICTRDQLRNMIATVEDMARKELGEITSEYQLYQFHQLAPASAYPSRCFTGQDRYPENSKERAFHCLRDHFRLAANIEFDDVGNMEPIRFKGILDGDGHEIRNPTVVDSLAGFIAPFTTNFYSPLFSTSPNNASFLHLVVRNPTVRGQSAVGGLVDRLGAYSISLVDDVHVVGGQVWGFTSVGGLAGEADGSPSSEQSVVRIRNSSVRDTLISFESSEAGGLVGRAAFWSILRIEDSFATARLQAVGVQGGQSNIGGLLGASDYIRYIQADNDFDFYDPLRDEDEPVLLRSWFRGSITMGHSWGGSNAGGLIGMNYGIPIVGSRAEANIAATGQGVGGLVGESRCGSRYFLDCMISHSSFLGTVWGGAGKAGASGAGGLIGVSFGGMVLDSRVESGSTIKGTFGVGGVIGMMPAPYLRLYRTQSDAAVGGSEGNFGGVIGSITTQRTQFTSGDNYLPMPFFREDSWSRAMTPEVGDIGVVNDGIGSQRNVDLDGVDP